MFDNKELLYTTEGVSGGGYRGQKISCCPPHIDYYPFQLVGIYSSRCQQSMSQVPTLRKSLKALAAVKAAAAAVVKKSKPRPHQVIIRVKRKRGDAAVDSLFVVAKEDDEPDRKRRLAAGSIAENLAGLNLEKNRDDQAMQQKLIEAPARLCYKRSRPTDLDDSFPDEEPGSRVTNSPQDEIKAVESLGTGASGSHLDAFLRKNSKAIMVSKPSVVDYLEVRCLLKVILTPFERSLIFTY